MKNTLNTFNSLLTLMAMVMFVINSFYGLLCIDGDRELCREAEHAESSCKDRISDGSATRVVSSCEIDEHKQDEDIRSRKDCERSETKAREDHRVFDCHKGRMGENDGTDFAPVTDRLDNKYEYGAKGGDKANHSIILCHRNILTGLSCLFVMILPVTFSFIIPKSPPPTP